MVTEQKQAAEDGPYVYLDPFLIRRRQINLGLSQTQLVGAMQVSPNTAKGAFRGNAIHPGTAHRLAKQLKCNVTDLLAPRDPGYVAPAIVNGPMAGATEWETQECLEPGRVASNGLHCFVCRMQHRYTVSRQGRLGEHSQLDIIDTILSSDDLEEFWFPFGSQAMPRLSQNLLLVSGRLLFSWGPNLRIVLNVKDCRQADDPMAYPVETENPWPFNECRCWLQIATSSEIIGEQIYVNQKGEWTQGVGAGQTASLWVVIPDDGGQV